MEMILAYLIRWVTQLSFYHAKRHEAVKYRRGVEIFRRGTEARSKNFGRGSTAFDKCEQRKATGRTGSGCSSEEFQKIDGFVLLKSAVIQNVPLTEFLSRATLTTHIKLRQDVV